jgi:hypothetical protein
MITPPRVTEANERRNPVWKNRQRMMARVTSSNAITDRDDESDAIRYQKGEGAQDPAEKGSGAGDRSAQVGIAATGQVHQPGHRGLHPLQQE